MTGGGKPTSSSGCLGRAHVSTCLWKRPMRMAAQGCWRRECTAGVAREVQLYLVIAVASDRRAGTGKRGPRSGKLVETHCRPSSADVLTKVCIR